MWAYKLGLKESDAAAVESVEKVLKKVRSDGYQGNAGEFLSAVETLNYVARVSLLPERIAAAKRENDTKGFENFKNLVRDLIHFRPIEEDEQTSLSDQTSIDEGFVLLFGERSTTKRYDSLQIGLFAAPALGEPGIDMVIDCLGKSSAHQNRLIVRTLCRSNIISDSKLLELIIKLTGTLQKSFLTSLKRERRTGVLESMITQIELGRYGVASSSIDISRLLYGCSPEFVKQYLSSIFFDEGKGRRSSKLSKIRFKWFWAKHSDVLLDVYRAMLEKAKSSEYEYIHSLWFPICRDRYKVQGKYPPRVDECLFELGLKYPPVKFTERHSDKQKFLQKLLENGPVDLFVGPDFTLDFSKTSLRNDTAKSISLDRSWDILWNTCLDHDANFPCRLKSEFEHVRTILVKKLSRRPRSHFSKAYDAQNRFYEMCYSLCCENLLKILQDERISFEWHAPEKSFVLTDMYYSKGTEKIEELPQVQETVDFLFSFIFQIVESQPLIATFASDLYAFFQPRDVSLREIKSLAQLAASLLHSRHKTLEYVKAQEKAKQVVLDCIQIYSEMSKDVKCSALTNNIYFSFSKSLISALPSKCDAIRDAVFELLFNYEEKYLRFLISQSEKELHHEFKDCMESINWLAMKDQHLNRILNLLESVIVSKVLEFGSKAGKDRGEKWILSSDGNEIVRVGTSWKWCEVLIKECDLTLASIRDRLAEYLKEPAAISDTIDEEQNASNIAMQSDCFGIQFSLNFQVNATNGNAERVVQDIFDQALGDNSILVLLARFFTKYRTAYPIEIWPRIANIAEEAVYKVELLSHSEKKKAEKKIQDNSFKFVKIPGLSKKDDTVGPPYHHVAHMDWFERAIGRAARALSTKNVRADLLLEKHATILNQEYQKALFSGCNVKMFSPGRREGHQAFMKSAIKSRSRKFVVTAMKNLAAACRNEQPQNRLDYMTDLDDMWEWILMLFLSPSPGTIQPLKPNESDFEESTHTDFTKAWVSIVRNCASAVNMSNAARSDISDIISSWSSEVKAFCEKKKTRRVPLEIRKIWIRGACQVEAMFTFLESGTSKIVVLKSNILDLAYTEDGKYEFNKHDWWAIFSAGYHEIQVEKPFTWVDETFESPDNRQIAERISNVVRVIGILAFSIDGLKESLLTLSTPHSSIEFVQSMLSICNAFEDVLGGVWYFMPALRQIVNLTFQSLVLLSKDPASNDKVKVQCSQMMRKVFAWWEIAQFCDSAYLDHGEKLQTAGTQLDLADAHKLDHLPPALKKVELFKNKRAFVERAVEILAIDESAIHLKSIMRAVSVYRPDFLYSFTMEDKDGDEIKGLFGWRNYWKDLASEDSEEKVGFRLFRNIRFHPLRLPEFLNRGIEKQCLRDIRNAKLDFATRQKMLMIWVRSAIVSSSSTNAMLSNLYDKADQEVEENGDVTVETSAFIKTIVDGFLGGDDPTASLAFLLSPSVIKRDRTNVTGHVISRLTTILPADKLVGMIKIALSPGRRESLRVSSHKNMVKVLCKLNTSSSRACLSMEWEQLKLHPDIRAEIVKAAVHCLGEQAFVQDAEGKDEERWALELIASTVRIEYCPQVLVVLLGVRLPSQWSPSLIGMIDRTSKAGNELVELFTFDTFDIRESVADEFCKTLLAIAAIPEIHSTVSKTFLLASLLQFPRSLSDEIIFGLIETYKPQRFATLEELADFQEADKPQEDMAIHIYIQCSVALSIFSSSRSTVEIAKFFKSSLETLVHEPTFNTPIRKASLSVVKNFLEMFDSAMKEMKRFPTRVEHARFLYSILSPSEPLLRTLGRIDSETLDCMNIPTLVKSSVVHFSK